VWIPWEVACGGRAHVLIVLHGNQGDRDPAPALGGGRHVERIVRELMLAGMVRPVILAEPIHFSFCGDGHGQGLYSQGFSFAQYRELLEDLAAQRGIRILSSTPALRPEPRPTLAPSAAARLGTGPRGSR
jgi:hypothetical protein